MIELRWVKDNGSDGMIRGVRAASGDWVVLQYRETEKYFYEPIIDENGIKTLNPIVADWQDVEISDD